MATGPRKVLVPLCLAVSLAYAAMKFRSVQGLWFNGVEYWQRLWRPFPDWGTGPELYGALLAAKWNGTRAFMYGMLLLAVIFFGVLYKRYKFLAFVLFEGALIELLNFVWVAAGKYLRGWSTPHSNGFMIQSLAWVAALSLAARYFYRLGDPAPDPLPAAGGESLSPLSQRAQRRLLYGCYAIAVAFLLMKWGFAYFWVFDTETIWGVAYRMYPDLGTGAARSGALLPAKWIGTSNFWYGLLILLTVYYSHKRRHHLFLGFLLLQGTFIEFFDGLWIANGKYNVGWYKSGWGDVSMIGGFLWVPVLLFCGIYLVGNPRPLPRVRDTIAPA